MATFLSFLFGYMLSQFYRSFLAVIAPELARELHLDPQALAGMQTAWIIGFSLMQFPVGWALDRIGPRRTVTVSMIAAVVGAILFAQAESDLALYVAMTLIGIGCSAIYMGAVFVLGRTYSAHRFALICSWLIGMGSAGNLVAATPLAYAATTIGWRAAMLGMAGLTAIAALLILAVIKDPARAERHEHDGFFAGILAVLKIRALWPILPITAVSYAVIIAERGLWAGPYLSEVHGLAPVDRGNALLIMAFAMSIGAMAYGPLDTLIKRKTIVSVGTALTALGFLVLGLGAPGLTEAVVTLAIIGGAGLTYGVLMAHGRAFFPDALLGRGLTLMNILFIGGAGVVQPISGWMMTRLSTDNATERYATLHTGFAIALIVTLVVYLFAKEKPQA